MAAGNPGVWRMARFVLLVAAIVGAFASTSALAAEAPSIRTIAGAGGAGFNGDGKPALSTRLSAPSGLVYDAAGNLFVADSGNHRIRRIGVDGTVTTVAGSGVGGFSGDGGPAVAAQLNFPRAIALAPDGTLYIADTGNNRVRRVTPDGLIATIAGTGVSEVNTDVLPAVQSILSAPAGLAIDPAGRLAHRRHGQRPRAAHRAGRHARRDRGGHLQLVVQRRQPAGDGGEPRRPGRPRLRRRRQPADRRGRQPPPPAHRRRDGMITTVAGIGAVYESTGDGGAAAAAGLNQPVGVAVDAKGVIFVSEMGGARVRRIGRHGRAHPTVAGTGEVGSTATSGRPRRPSCSTPRAWPSTLGAGC